MGSCFIRACSLALVTFALSLDPATVYGIAPIERRVPPIGIEIPDEVRTHITQRLSQLNPQLKQIGRHPMSADVDVLLKAVRLALAQREIYKPVHLKLLGKTLDLAEQRLKKISSGEADWLNERLTVRGFYSRIDGSPQPYGLVIPEDLPIDTRVPLFVWLHGRGDKTTDIHFIHERMSRDGQIAPSNAIVLHPFGRQCIGFKSAGETDVLEAIEHVKNNYAVDPTRVVLMGFSMGGAGAWHLAAHYTDEFVGVSPGAGFAETSKYQNYSAEKIAATPEYEQKLWGVYDVPSYTRNLFNLPIVCYSGEKDKQIQAARIMESAFKKHGKRLDHVIGPGMGHKYHPDALAEIMSKMDHAVKSGRPSVVKTIHLQTQTLRYSKMHWMHIDRLGEHWKDSRVDANLSDDAIRVTTKNVTQLTITPIPAGVRQVTIDNDAIATESIEQFTASRPSGTETGWKRGPLLESDNDLAKKPGLQGPIDDAFLDRFIVVTPVGSSSNELRNQWTQFELQHLRERWSALFRGTLPEKSADEVTEQDIRDCNLVLFGEPNQNAMLRRVLAAMPQHFKDGAQSRRSSFGGPNRLAQLIYPNPLNPAKYVVLNSGPTFREAHDRTNSLQNPKLPDWAIIDISTPPNAERAGKVVKAGFFDENWRFQ